MMKIQQHSKKLPTRYNFVNETGKTHGEWKVIRYAGPEKSSASARWLCECSCGRRAVIRGSKLRNGQSIDCRSSVHKRNRATRFPEYRVYTEARQRCTNPNSWSWKQYGGRGIKFKFKSFWEFIAALNGFRPSARHQLDRYPDNDGHYEAGNVRWATPSENAMNRRSSMKKAA